MLPMSLHLHYKHYELRVVGNLLLCVPTVGILCAGSHDIVLLQYSSINLLVVLEMFVLTVNQ